MYTTGVRILVWMCVLTYLMQHIYYPVVEKLLGLAYIGHQNFSVFQFVTYAFVHGDVFHILINMLMLVIFGSHIEKFLGINKLFTVFTLSVITGGIFEMISNMMAIHSITGTYFPPIAMDFYDQVKYSMEYGSEFTSTFNRITIGASAGVFGCMIAFTTMFPKERIGFFFLPFSFSARLVIVCYVAMEIYSALFRSIPNVAHFAHLGGALAGLLVGLYWAKTLRTRK